MEKMKGYEERETDIWILRGIDFPALPLCYLRSSLNCANENRKSLSSEDDVNGKHCYFRCNLMYRAYLDS